MESMPKPEKSRGNKTLIVVIMVVIVAAAVLAVVLLPGLMNNDDGEGDDTDDAVPIMVGSNLFGSTSNEEFRAMALGQDGSAYLVGLVEGDADISTPGAFDTSFGGYIDIIVVKMTSDLTVVMACTYLGGDGYDRAYSISIGPNGNVFIAGSTSSEDFPVTAGVYNATGKMIDDEYKGNVFVTELDPTLTTLVTSTYTGAVVEDPQVQIAFDSEGNIVIAGSVRAGTMAATDGAYDLEYSGDIDGFIQLMNNEMTDVMAATYLGGAGTDLITSMLIDDQGDVLVSAEVVPDELFSTADGYIYKLTRDLSELNGSFQLGGPQWDRINDIVLDDLGNVIAVGWTDGEFPVTDGAFDSVGHSEIMGFVARVDAALTSVMDATYYGDAYPMSAICDVDGNIVVTGSGSSIPTTDNAIQKTSGGNMDLYVSVFDPTLSNLEYATYLGGTWNDGEGTGSALSSNGTVYVCGFTQSIDFPTLDNDQGNVVPGESSDGVTVAIKL